MTRQEGQGATRSPDDAERDTISARGGGEAPASSPTGSRQPLTLHEELSHYVQLWKTSVEVQQHFNDIEWRIRGLALTVATFALGAAGVAAKDGTRIGLISLGSLVLILGLLLWYAFYFVDRYWYHPLLKGAVDSGTGYEQAIKRHLPEANMTATITERSSQPVGRFVRFVAGRKGFVEKDGKHVMHSDQKLRWFYRVGSFTFVLGAIALQIAAMVPAADNPPPPLVVQIQSPSIPSAPTAPATVAPTEGPRASSIRTP